MKQVQYYWEVQHLSYNEAHSTFDHTSNVLSITWYFCFNKGLSEWIYRKQTRLAKEMYKKIGQLWRICLNHVQLESSKDLAVTTRIITFSPKMDPCVAYLLDGCLGMTSDCVLPLNLESISPILPTSMTVKKRLQLLLWPPSIRETVHTKYSVNTRFRTLMRFWRNILEPTILELFVVRPNEITVIKWAYDLDINDDFRENEIGQEYELTSNWLGLSI